MGSKLILSPGFCLLWALCLLLLPLRWAMGALLAAVIHEFAHYLAIYGTGGQVYSINLGGNSVTMETAPMSPVMEVLCALAGPLGSFSLVLISEYFPEAAVCGLAQGAYNLIPVFPLDGGRVARCLLPRKICRCLEVVFLTILTVLSLWASMISLKLAAVLLMAGAFPLIRGKFTCKGAPFAVQ